MSQLQDAAAQMVQHFASTGVYKSTPSVLIRDGPAVKGLGPTHEMVVQLAEADKTLTMGASRTLNGSLTMSTSATLLNPTGMGESLSVDIGGSSRPMDMSTLVNLANSATSAQEAAAALSRARTSVSPAFHATFRKPTLAGRLFSTEYTFRSEVENLDPSVGFSTKVRALDASITAPNRRHSLTYGLAWRDLLPLPHPESLFQTGSSAAVAADCNASLKSSIGYAYRRDEMVPRGSGLPASGYRLALSTEVTGLGGDVFHAKAEAGLTLAASLFRQAPDTGYMPALAKGAWQMAASGKLPQAERDQILSWWQGGLSPSSSSMRVLKPYILALERQKYAVLQGEDAAAALRGIGVSSPPPPASSSSSSSSQHTHTHASELSEEAMLSPEQRAARFLHDEKGVGAATTKPSSSSSSSSSSSTSSASSTDASTAASVTRAAPLGLSDEEYALAGAQARAAVYSLSDRLAGWFSPGVTGILDLHAGALARYGADASRASGARMCDRFFLTGQRMRGFHVVGPRAPRVPFGTIFGDALGGEATASAGVRVILPPPLPSVRMTNAGVRTHLFANAGFVAPAVASLSANSIRDGAAASAGVGVIMPIASFTVEANYAFWHRKGASAIGTDFRIQFMA